MNAKKIINHFFGIIKLLLPICVLFFHCDNDFLILAKLAETKTISGTKNKCDSPTGTVSRATDVLVKLAETTEHFTHISTMTR